MVRHNRGQRMPARLGVVEIACRIGLQTHREFVEMLGDLMVVVEVFNEIHLAITVEVSQANELVAAGDKQLIAAKLHAERLEESARDAAPAQRSW